MGGLDMKTDKKTINLIKKWEKAEQDLFDNISEKKNFSGECNCDFKDGVETISIIHEGDYEEIIHFCVMCGGVK